MNAGIETRGSQGEGYDVLVDGKFVGRLKPAGIGIWWGRYFLVANGTTSSGVYNFTEGVQAIVGRAKST
jgi:hypothetical protein